jgi:hypothetical protein
VVDLDRAEGRLLLFHLAQPPEHFRHTTVIGFGLVGGARDRT